MVCKDTLKIRNLPKELNDAQKEEFAKHFGAIKVKVITSKVKQKSVIYAKFESPEVAKNVMLRLHQTQVLNNHLSVEFAENDLLQAKPLLKKIEEAEVNNKKYFKSFVAKLNSFNESVNFHQPPPSHLKYLYPKANRATINNIAHALMTIPRFYTQVLHLMNKMNLPPPFALPDNAVRPQQPVVPVSSGQVAGGKSGQESSESELESDEDSKTTKDIIPAKRNLPQKKVVKRPKFIKPNVVTGNTGSKGEKAENVFEKVEVQTNRKIELKVTSDNLDHLKPAPEQQENSKMESSPTSEAEHPSEPNQKVISDEELQSNQIPLKDLGVLPVFKNYHPGAPTNRLYIKNCAKTVVLADLEYIYNRYKMQVEGEASQFDIRLMQEGRMKGQAFVTLDSVELAQKAVKETNGFVLKEKPLVVVFAKSAAPKK